MSIKSEVFSADEEILFFFKLGELLARDFQFQKNCSMGLTKNKTFIDSRTVLRTARFVQFLSVTFQNNFADNETLHEKFKK